MRRTARLIVLLVAAWWATGCAPSWQQVRSEPGGYTVEMPGEPTDSTEDTVTALGKLTSHIATLDMSSSTYVASYCDLPSGSEARVEVKELLKESLKGMVTALNGKQEGEIKDVELSGNPGMEVQFRMTQPAGAARARVFLVKSRLYTILVAHGEGSENPADMERFLNSFQLASDK